VVHRLARNSGVASDIRAVAVRGRFNETRPSADLRELPSYGITEAAHHLRLPTATLRSWLRGRHYPTEGGRKYFKPVIDLPDPELASLSFVNLVEAHVLDAIRREHRIPLPNVRSALDYVRKQFGSEHPLAEQKFETDGVNLFISRFQDLISVSESGQLAIRELIQARLRRIEHDAAGFAIQWTRWPTIMVANVRKSKKRSAASSPSLPDRLIFFTDANLGPPHCAGGAPRRRRTAI